MDPYTFLYLCLKMYITTAKWPLICKLIEEKETKDSKQQKLNKH